MKIINKLFGTRISIYTPVMWGWFTFACYIAFNLKEISMVNDNFWSFGALYIIVVMMLTHIEKRIMKANARCSRCGTDTNLRRLVVHESHIHVDGGFNKNGGLRYEYICDECEDKLDRRMNRSIGVEPEEQ